jgi:hypothetical protein
MGGEFEGDCSGGWTGLSEVGNATGGENMKEAQEAAKRLYAYFSKLSSDSETDYPDGFDPEEDSRAVVEAFAEV